MKQNGNARKPYGGATRSLVIALDVGTTFSGVSYAILEPGEVPKIHGVTRFPGQEHVAGNSKIPSVIFYDPAGKMRAAGAEADNASVLTQAEDEGWTKVELFKLRLRPKTMRLQMNGMSLNPLPDGKTATEVFGDFLSYLYTCTRSFIVDTYASGPALWSSVEWNIQFVLSHPNGWEGAQQAKMRRSAIYGGLIPNTNEGKARVRFVTEGEASLHACVLSGLAVDVLSNPSNPGFMIADAGGGTLDISTYAIRGTVPLIIEEIAPPDCVFAGSIFVSRRARVFLEEKLKNSKYGTPDALDHITKRFDETTKRLFRGKNEAQFIPFGSPLDKDMTVGIRGGQLKLTGEELVDLFEPSVQAAVASIRAQIDAAAGLVKSVWLVGGFAASPYLFKQLQERLAPLDVAVSRPDSQTSKAVADGSIGFYLDHHVSARVSKFMYGVEYLREFDSQDDEHIARRHRLCELPSGPRLLPDAFDCILARGLKVKESTVFTRKYCTELTNLSTLAVFEVDIWCYRGGNAVPRWILRQAEEFSTLCCVRADLSPLRDSARPKAGKDGGVFWTIVFSVEIHFGLTEFKARIKWVDDGRIMYGPASIIYNEGGLREEDDEQDSSAEDGPNRVSSRPASKPASRARSPLASGSITRESSKGVSPYAHVVFVDAPSPRIRHRASQSSTSTPYTLLPYTETQSKREKDGKKGKGKEQDRGRARDKGKEKEKTSNHQSVDILITDDLNGMWGPARPTSPIMPATAMPSILNSSSSKSPERPMAKDIPETPRTTKPSAETPPPHWSPLTQPSLTSQNFNGVKPAQRETETGEQKKRVRTSSLVWADLNGTSGSAPPSIASSNFANSSPWRREPSGRHQQNGKEQVPAFTNGSSGTSRARVVSSPDILKTPKETFRSIEQIPSADQSVTRIYPKSSSSPSKMELPEMEPISSLSMEVVGALNGDQVGSARKGNGEVQANNIWNTNAPDSSLPAKHTPIKKGLSFSVDLGDDLMASRGMNSPSLWADPTINHTGHSNHAGDIHSSPKPSDMAEVSKAVNLQEPFSDTLHLVDLEGAWPPVPDSLSADVTSDSPTSGAHQSDKPKNKDSNGRPLPPGRDLPAPEENGTLPSSVVPAATTLDVPSSAEVISLSDVLESSLKPIEDPPTSPHPFRSDDSISYPTHPHPIQPQSFPPPKEAAEPVMNADEKQETAEAFEKEEATDTFVQATKKKKKKKTGK